MKLSTIFLLMLVAAAVGSASEDLLVACARLAFVVFATLAATLASGSLFHRPEPKPIPLYQEIQRRDRLKG